ncbi:MAG TPA: flagellar hook-basal body complex protein [Ruminiclostridium sp.]|nr:flagellar hook-basal body complex protein [Ruminiclostridium sp.]
MMRSMMSAVTGLRAQQTAMDVIGNNIANVNTAGFRSSSTQFEDLYYQTLNGGTAETNPSQVGYGAQVSGVSKNMTSSGATTTDNPWDLYIDGSGYFAVSTNKNASSASYYTRVGNFTFDTSGYLVDASGNYVMGTSDNGATMSPICLQGANVSINGTTIDSNVYKDLRDITFNNDGSISASYQSKPGKIQIATTSGGTTTYSDLKVALATFVNENGLAQAGNNDYESTESSGNPSYTVALNGSTTKIRSNALEMSNVDMAKEFTNMIVTQRGYQANSRVITVSDSMLDELINLKRS